MWVKWRKQQGSVIQLTPEKSENAKDVTEKVFNSKMIKIFQNSNIDEILKQVFTHIKTQIKNPALSKSGFTLDSIMHRGINFYKLQLTQGNLYIKLTAWITLKKAVLNPKNRKNEQCSKRGVIVALYYDKIGNGSQCISKLKCYEDQYNWSRFKFLLEISKIDKFENEQ